jgi:hypothetical protein
MAKDNLKQRVVESITTPKRGGMMVTLKGSTYSTI